MLAKLEMKLNTNETIVGAMASVFHGALMEQLSDEYATMLHESRLHPYAQHLEKRDGQWYWVVSVLNTQAKINKIDRLTRGIHFINCACCASLTLYHKQTLTCPAPFPYVRITLHS